jgi:hypothetical protein
MTAKAGVAKSKAPKAAKRSHTQATAGAEPRVGKRRPDPVASGTKGSAKERIAHPNAGLTYFDLAVMSAHDLQIVFDAAIKPTFGQLLGWEFRGWNPPRFARILGFQKFKKGFFLDEGQTADGAAISGYNVFVHQNWLDDPHIVSRKDGHPKYHGFYKVSEVDPGAADNKHPHALLLNYGIGTNASYNPERVIRDYLVQVDPNNPDLLLGKAYIALGPARVFSNFFVLDRYNKAEFDPAEDR